VVLVIVTGRRKTECKWAQIGTAMDPSMPPFRNFCLYTHILRLLFAFQLCIGCTLSGLIISDVFLCHEQIFEAMDHQISRAMLARFVTATIAESKRQQAMGIFEELFFEAGGELLRLLLPNSVLLSWT
jgi:hypothetical protein